MCRLLRQRWSKALSKLNPTALSPRNFFRDLLDEHFSEGRNPRPRQLENCHPVGAATPKFSIYDAATGKGLTLTGGPDAPCRISLSRPAQARYAASSHGDAALRARAWSWGIPHRHCRFFFFCLRRNIFGRLPRSAVPGSAPSILTSRFSQNPRVPPALRSLLSLSNQRRLRTEPGFFALAYGLHRCQLPARRNHHGSAGWIFSSPFPVLSFLPGSHCLAMVAIFSAQPVPASSSAPSCSSSRARSGTSLSVFYSSLKTIPRELKESRDHLPFSAAGSASPSSTFPFPTIGPRLEFDDVRSPAAWFFLMGLR